MININTTSEKIVKKLEDEQVKYIFGYPGEQILSLYEQLRKSSIEHILVRHEQAAAHAADAYARITGKPGICISTAGPGAMNLVMGVSTAFKDNVPMIVITGDVPSNIKGLDRFQDIDINSVFKPITLKSYYADTPEKAVYAIYEAFNTFHNGITGPIHINIPKDVQNKLQDIEHKVINNQKIKEPSQSDINDIIKMINNAERPLIIAGSGIIYADAIDALNTFIEKTEIPLTTTYSARGIISEKSDNNLGLAGIRGTTKSNYATLNSDCIIALATRLSERTIQNIKTDNIIQINTKKESLNAKYEYQYNIKEVLERLNTEKIEKTKEDWINNIQKQENKTQKTLEDTTKIHPEKAIQIVLDMINHFDNITITNDAGSHSTYTTIDSILTKNSQILFSGGFGPMGYGIPASIGASFARRKDHIICILGDGDIQMTIEELATIKQYNIPVVIIIINNSKLGIIKQWQDMNNNKNYQIELDNPDFSKIATAYNINSKKVVSLDGFKEDLIQAIKSNKPYLFDVDVEYLPIPLAKKINKK